VDVELLVHGELHPPQILVWTLAEKIHGTVEARYPAEARQNGGDAVIFVSSASQLAGYYTATSASAYGYGNSATAFGSSTTVPITRRSSTYVVIKYL
jgi:hypothetical protein